MVNDWAGPGTCFFSNRGSSLPRCFCYLLDSRTSCAPPGWLGLQELQCSSGGEIRPFAGRDQFVDKRYCLLLQGQRDA